MHCNDNEFLAHEQAVEICDDIDNDCDGVIDEELKTIFFFVRYDNTTMIYLAFLCQYKG